VPDWITDSVHLPHGYAVQDLRSACEAITWFLIRGLDCMVKPDRGESGLGIQFFDHRVAHQNLLAELQSNAFCKDENILVEEYIKPKAGLSPSLELFVPPPGCGEPYITYLSNQHFGQLGRFSGVIIAKSYLESNWYPALAENGLRIANRLQKLGYIGNFDMDTVIDQQGQVYLLELNTRRTGGTHAHEYGRFAFTDHYLDDVALFSANQVNASGVSTLDQLFERLSPVLFPICSEKRGVVITVTSTLQSGDFGCLIVGESVADLLEIKQEMESLLHPVVQGLAT
jgi:phosphoribosylglycinamide formyltransferase 2